MEKLKKFKHEDRFINFVTEKNKILYSVIELIEGHTLTTKTLLDKPKFTSYLLDGIQYSDGIIYLDSIFVYDNDIYVYLSKSELIDSLFSCRIYYPIERKKDVDFFILNLNKLKKNGN
jgi:hypothetical protein